jgi:hypothetical protein
MVLQCDRAATLSEAVRAKLREGPNLHSNLLAHEREARGLEADDGQGDQRDDLRPDQQQALIERDGPDLRGLGACWPRLGESGASGARRPISTDLLSGVTRLGA